MEKIEQKTLHQEVTNRIREMILSGHLVGGQKILEKSLCELLGVSRTPVRESLRILHAEGFIDLIPQKGAFVLQQSTSDIRELFEVMSCLEGICTRLAVEKMSKKNLDDLERIHKELESHYATGNREAYLEVNWELHLAIQKISRNKVLDNLMDGFRKKILLFRRWQLYKPGRFDQSIKEHREILAAFRQKDAELAEKKILNHLSNQAQSLIDAFSSDSIKAEPALPQYLNELPAIFSVNPAISFLRKGEVETSFSYAQLDHQVNCAAHVFLAENIKKGDRIILCIEKSLAWVVAYLACQRIGAVCVPLTTGFTQAEMDYFFDDIQASLAVVEPVQAEMITDQSLEIKILVIDSTLPYHSEIFSQEANDIGHSIKIKSDDPAVIIYTSGTTGKPKGVVLTHGNLAHDVHNIIQTWEITSSDVLCHALPLFHIHGLSFALNTFLIAGGHILMMDSFSSETVLSVLGKRNDQNQCTTFMGVPAMYHKLLDNTNEQHRNFNHIRLWTSGSAPLLGQDFYRIKEILGKEVVEREGMSETGMNFSNPLNGKRKPGSVGLPLPNLQVRIVQPESGKEVELGQIGEIWLKGPSITKGYWRKSEETKKVFENGWFRTGDLGHIDKDGYYYITDRIKHIIISGGENISPKEIEQVINAISGVIESAVVGVTDYQWGEKVAAAVVKTPGTILNIEDIKKACVSSLHKWKCPKEIIFVDNLPKNTMGKILVDEVERFFEI